MRRKHSVRVTVLGRVEPHGVEGLAEMQDIVDNAFAGEPLSDVLGFVDPAPFYRRSRFFVLPADVVFCNFALLEAMSHGVVPIVSDTPGARLVVSDGVSGIIADHSAEGLRRGLERALSLDQDDWRAGSAGARRAVQEEYSIERWGARLLDEYRIL